MRSSRGIFIFFFFFAVAIGAWLIAAPCAAATAQNAFTINVPKLAQAPSMDGAIDASWAKAASVLVDYDFTYQRASDPMMVYVAQDPRGLDVAFAVTQKGPITDNEQTNGAGVFNDDAVGIALWPQGTQGFMYQFMANPRGAKVQSSSENTQYSPQWTAVGRLTATGYVVTMRIPLDVIRSAHSQDWKVQFYRMTVATNSMEVWFHVDGQSNAIDPSFSGSLVWMSAPAQSAALRPKPRLQLYGLGELTSLAYGGNTSRVGADVAIPVTATSSLLGTFHPDYSNLETDQQTIAPNAYARRYFEVRPFFTQATANYNASVGCLNCPTTLYTPAIPEFSQGYAYEGTQGPFTFGAFDAVGTKRTDSGAALNWNVSSTKDSYGIDLQQVAVNTVGLHDVTSSVDTGYLNEHTHFFEYLNYGEDRGSDVLDPGLGNYLEYGAGYQSQLTIAGVTAQRIGEFFNPVDGYTAQTDIAGYETFLYHKMNFASTAPLQDISVSGTYGDFHDRFGRPAQVAGYGQLNFDFHHQVELHLFTSTSGIETAYSGEFLPYNGNGFFLGYKTETSTPVGLTYSGGPYDHGHLTSWSYFATQPLRRGLDLSLEADESLYAPSATVVEPVAQQWLERASLDWQMSQAASFDLGIRRIIGRNLPNSFQAPDFTNTLPCGTLNGFSPFDCVNAGNVSFAFHFLSARNEYYIVYGNPNNLATLPALYLKWIRYFGAEKGT